MSTERDADYVRRMFRTVKTPSGVDPVLMQQITSSINSLSKGVQIPITRNAFGIKTPRVLALSLREEVKKPEPYPGFARSLLFKNSRKTIIYFSNYVPMHFLLWEDWDKRIIKRSKCYNEQDLLMREYRGGVVKFIEIDEMRAGYSSPRLAR